MLGFYVLSFFAGAGVGVAHAIVFFKGSRQVFEPLDGAKNMTMSGVGSFAVRYVLLFVLLFVLYFTLKLNIYAGMAGFFVAYWGVLLKRIKDYDAH